MYPIRSAYPQQNLYAQVGKYLRLNSYRSFKWVGQPNQVLHSGRCYGGTKERKAGKDARPISWQQTHLHLGAV